MGNGRFEVLAEGSLTCEVHGVFRFPLILKEARAVGTDVFVSVDFGMARMSFLLT